MRASRTETTTEPRRRPGGRSARVREAVIAATVAELQEVGYEKLSVAAVAARAGVHESSIYRRWKSREGLVEEATFKIFALNVAVPDKGSLLEDLVSLSSSAAQHLKSPLGRAAMQFSLTVHTDDAVDGELHDLWAVRFKNLKLVFERAVVRNEWPQDADPTPLMEALIGVVYARIFLFRQPVGPKYLRGLVEAIFGVYRSAK